MTKLTRRNFLGASAAAGAGVAAATVPAFAQSASASGTKAATIIETSPAPGRKMM